MYSRILSAALPTRRQWRKPMTSSRSAAKPARSFPAGSQERLVWSWRSDKGQLQRYRLGSRLVLRCQRCHSAQHDK